MLLPKFLSRKISPEKSLDFLSQKSVVRPALVGNRDKKAGFEVLRKTKQNPNKTIKSSPEIQSFQLMAIPNQDAGHGTFSPVVSTRPTNKALRVAATGAAVILACAAVVALVGVSTQNQEAELVIVQPHASLNELADYFLANGNGMSPKDAMSKIKAWNSGTPAASLAVVAPGKTQMLNSYKSTSELADSSLLCEKREKIIKLFDELLAKLGGEELSANITMGKVTAEWKDALSSWLDSESQYRLTVEKTKEAKDGSEFARNEYEKWKTAHSAAKRDLAATLARHAEERQNLLDERGETLRFRECVNGIIRDGCAHTCTNRINFLCTCDAPTHIFSLSRAHAQIDVHATHSQSSSRRSCATSVCCMMSRPPRSRLLLVAATPLSILRPACPIPMPPRRPPLLRSLQPR